MSTNTRDRPHCGDIWMCNLIGKDGSVQRGYRPVMIISNDVNNERALTLNVIPITSSRKKHLPVHVDILDYNNCGLNKPSRLLIEQTTTISVDRLNSYVGHISNPALMDKISRAFHIQFPILRV